MASVLRSQSAFARLFVGKTEQILNKTNYLAAKIADESLEATRKYSNYASSPFITKIKEQYEFDIVKNPQEWSYVERLMPFDTIPQVTLKESYPSGWKPPREEARDLPYFICRDKDHEIPIYLNLSLRGQRKISKIKKIEGDIWLLNDEIKSYLKTKNGKYIETRVHELARFIEVKGDYVNQLLAWAHSKGF